MGNRLRETCGGTRRIKRAGLGALALLLVMGIAAGLDTSIWQYDSTPFRDSRLRTVCQENLQRAQAAIEAYAETSSGSKFPRLSDTSGNLMFRQDDIAEWLSIYPPSRESNGTLICPAPERAAPVEAFDDSSYIYIGYLLAKDEDVTSFANAYDAELETSTPFVSDLNIPSSYGDKLLRLREGIERFFITDINDPGAGIAAAASIPVLWEWPDNHQTGWGGNVVYLDGHIEFVPYPGKFPMTETAVAALGALAGYTPPTAWKNTLDYAIPYPYLAKGGRFIQDGRDKLYDLSRAMHLYYSYADPVFPRLSNEPNRMMVRADDIYPEYTLDRALMNATGAPLPDPTPFFDDQDFVYLGYLLANEADVQSFATAYATEIAAGGDFSTDLDHAASYGEALLRLRKGVEAALLTDPDDPGEAAWRRMQIPVAIEWPDDYEDVSGGHVLFLDGQVKWHAYPGEFPMTEASITTLRALAQAPAKTAWTQFVPRPADSPDRFGFVSRCWNQLRRLGERLPHYAQDNWRDGYHFPQLSSESGRLMFDDDIFPSPVSDPRSLICPGPVRASDTRYFDDQHYAYVSHALMTDADVQNFVAAYRAGADLSLDLPVPASYGDSLLRLRNDVTDGFEVPVGTPLQNIPTAWDIPILIEWPGNHEGRSGGHVVFLDGHLEWIDFPGKFPMTEATIATLGNLAGWNRASTWRQLDLDYGAADHRGQGLCINNMSSIAVAISTLLYPSPVHLYPKLSSTPKNLMFDEDYFLKFHLRDLRRLNCPGSPAAYHHPSATDHSYVYLGYFVYDLETLEAFKTAYTQAIAGDADFTSDLSTGGTTLYRLEGNVSYRYFNPETLDPPPAIFGEQDVPILIEWSDNHGAVRGGHVLYMDGRIDWIDYPGRFPMTVEAMAILTELAGREPIREAPAAPEATRLEQRASATTRQPEQGNE